MPARVSKTTSVMTGRTSKSTITTSAAIATNKPLAEYAIANVAGAWNLMLTDIEQRSINLTLSQYVDVVYGTSSGINATWGESADGNIRA